MDKSLDEIIKTNRDERKKNNPPNSKGNSKSGGEKKGGAFGKAPRRRQNDSDSHRKPRSVVGAAPPKGNVVKASNLHYDITSAELMDVFKQVDGLSSADVQFNASGRSEGYAVLKFDSKHNANKFKSEYEGVALDGRPLKIEVLDGGKPTHLETRRVVTVDRSTKAKVFEGKSGRQDKKRGGSVKPKKAKEAKPAKSVEDLDKELDEYKNE